MRADMRRPIAASAGSFRRFGTRRAALRSRLPMLVPVVGYAMLSLWILVQPIVEV